MQAEFFRGVEARAWDGTLTEGEKMVCEGERKRERDRQREGVKEGDEGWPGGTATPDATLRFETGENEVGASAVRRYFPPALGIAGGPATLSPPDCYLHRLLTLF